MTDSTMTIPLHATVDTWQQDDGDTRAIISIGAPGLVGVQVWDDTYPPGTPWVVPLGDMLESLAKHLRTAEPSDAELFRRVQRGARLVGGTRPMEWATRNAGPPATGATNQGDANTGTANIGAPPTDGASSKGAASTGATHEGPR